jgi:hypothetical protein
VIVLQQHFHPAQQDIKPFINQDSLTFKIKLKKMQYKNLVHQWGILLQIKSKENF